MGRTVNIGRSPTVMLLTTTSAVSAQANANQPPPQDAPEAGAISDSVVTAQKREERLQKVGVSVRAFSGETRTKAGVASINDLAKAVRGLRGIVGRKIASVPGYRYSPALRGRGGQTWTPQTLDRRLSDTQKFAPGSNMTYFSDDPQRRDLIIKYLAGQKWRRGSARYQSARRQEHT